MKTLIFLAFFALPHIAKAQVRKKLYKTIGMVKIYEFENKGVYFFRTGFSFDADGAPKAYDRNNEVALEYLANAGRSGNWWGILTNTEKKD